MKLCGDRSNPCGRHSLMVGLLPGFYEFPGFRAGWSDSPVPTGLTYADDITLLGDGPAVVQYAPDDIDRFAKAVGLRIKASKAKVLST